MEDNNKPDIQQAGHKAARTITFFNSFQEMEEDKWKRMAATTYEQRLTHLEEFRRQVYHSSLLPDGSWPLLSRKLTVIKLPYEVCR